MHVLSQAVAATVIDDRRRAGARVRAARAARPPRRGEPLRPLRRVIGGVAAFARGA
jgi:hypothetical protein